MEYEDMDMKQRRTFQNGENAYYEGKTVDELCGAKTPTRDPEFMQGYYAAQEEHRLEEQNKL